MNNTLQRLLNRFHLDWASMKAIMMTTGAVISGSAALAVLQEGKFVPQDIDIYVTSENIAAILAFLLEQGYKLVTKTTEKRYATTVTLSLKYNGGEKIDLIVTTESHVVHAITRFHSTCVMNYIAYYGIVCLYPHWTMRDIGFVRKGKVDQQAIYKYRGRGFAMVDTASKLPDYEANHMCGRHHCCPKAKRELCDHVTFCIPFEEEGQNIYTEEGRGRVGWILDEDYECEA